MATIDAPVQLDAPVPQWQEALRDANVVRLGGRTIKRELKAGRMSLRQALHDPRAGVLTVYNVLCAQPRWGRDRTTRLLSAAAVRDPRNRISETKRVRELTDRQKALLIEWCES